MTQTQFFTASEVAEQMGDREPSAFVLKGCIESGFPSVEAECQAWPEPFRTPDGFEARGEVVRFTNPLDSGTSPGAFFVPPGDPPYPVLIVSRPYNAFEAGDDADRKFYEASSELELQADSECPIKPKEPSPCHMWVPSEPIAALPAAYAWYLRKGFALFFIYGRFYRGRSLLSMVYDVVSGIEFLKADPRADNDRLAITGVSLGGCMSIAPLARPEFPLQLAASVPVCGVQDFAMANAYVRSIAQRYKGKDLETYLDFFLPYLAREALGTGLRPDLLEYQQWTSEANARAIDTPMLLLTGTDDTMVPCEQSIRLHQELKAAGKDVGIQMYDNGSPPLFPARGLLGHGWMDASWYAKQELLTRNFILSRIPLPVEITINTAFHEPVSLVYDAARLSTARPELEGEVRSRLLETTTEGVRYEYGDRPEYNGRGEVGLARAMNLVTGMSVTPDDVKERLLEPVFV